MHLQVLDCPAKEQNGSITIAKSNKGDKKNLMATVKVLESELLGNCLRNHQTEQPVTKAETNFQTCMCKAVRVKN